MAPEFIDYSAGKNKSKSTAQQDNSDSAPAPRRRSTSHRRNGDPASKSGLDEDDQDDSGHASSADRDQDAQQNESRHRGRTRSKSRERRSGGLETSRKQSRSESTPRTVLPSVVVNSDPIVDYRRPRGSKAASTAEVRDDNDDDEGENDDEQETLLSRKSSDHKSTETTTAAPARRKSVTYAPETPGTLSSSKMSRQMSSSDDARSRSSRESAPGNQRKSGLLAGMTSAMSLSKSNSITSGDSGSRGGVQQQPSNGPRKLRRKSLSAVKPDGLQLGPSLDGPPVLGAEVNVQGPAKLRRRSSSRGARSIRSTRSRNGDEWQSDAGEPQVLRRRSSSRASSVRRSDKSGHGAASTRAPFYALSGDEDDEQAQEQLERSQSRSRSRQRGLENGHSSTNEDRPRRRQSIIVAAPPIENRWSDSDDDSDLERKSSARRRKGRGQSGQDEAPQNAPGRLSRRVEEHVDSQGLDLTPQDRHYLNRILVNLEMSREGSLLSGIGTLSQYGSPFLPHPNGPNSRPAHLSKGSDGGFLGGWLGGGGGSGCKMEGFQDYRWDEEKAELSPVLKYLFWRFVYHAPVLREAKETYWTEQIQPFFDSFAERDLSTTTERSEVTKRRLLVMGITRILGTYYSTCIPALGRQAPARPTVTMMRRIDHLVPGSMNAMWSTWFPNEPPAYNAWTAVVAEEQDRGEPAFLIVSRVVVVDPNPTYLVLRRWTAFSKFASALESIDPNHTLELPLLPRIAHGNRVPTRARVQQYLRSLVIALSAPPEDVNDDSTVLSDARAKLEAFLLGSAEKVRASELESWVAAGEKEEIEADRRREKWTNIGKKGKQLRSTWVQYRAALIEGDEIDKSMATVKKTATLSALPAHYKCAEKWASIWVAYALHYFFVSSTHAPEVLNLLKSFHDLLPYGAMKLGLSLVNPTLAIKAVVQIVLGQPAGQPSLFQRIFSIICNGGIKHQKKLVEAARKRVNNDSMCNSIEKHVYAAFTERAETRAAADDKNEDILITIIRKYGSDYEVKQVKQWQTEYAQWTREGTPEEDLATDDPVNRFINLKDVLASYCRKRDREQVLNIVMEPNTPRLLHASIAVFYGTIYKVANASNLAARLGDLQAFLDDLIHVAYSDKKSPADFIKLTARHDQQLYFLVHELASNGGTLLDPLIDWCKSGLAFIDKGIPPANPPRRRGSTASRKSASKRDQTSSAASSPSNRAAVNVDELIAELPDKSRRAVLAEARSLARWSRYKKAYADICLRVDMLQAQEGGTGLGALELDKDELYQDLLAQDRSVRDQLVQVEANGVEGGLEWAWFANPDVANVASGEQRKFERQQRDQKRDEAEKQRAKAGGGGGGLFRTKSRTTTVSEGGNNHGASDRATESAKKRLQVPEPTVSASRRLLAKYRDMLGPALEAARANGVK